jgi:hypothetical protein
MTVKLKLNNVVINGNFQYWQRGTSLAMLNNTASYLADRWTTHRVGASWAYTTSISTDVPSSSNSQYSMQLSTTTASAMAVGDYAILAQAIEGSILRGFKNKKMVVSFWVKSTKTGVFCAQVCSSGAASRRYLVEYTVNASNTWEKKTFRFTHDSTGTWDYTAGAGMVLAFTIAAGNNFLMTANSWQTTAANAFKTSNQVNGMDNVANVFKIADVVMVEDNEGQTRNPDFTYAGRDVFEELQLCQRYYESCPFTGLGPGRDVYHNTQFKVLKRATPLLSFTNINGNTTGFAIQILQTLGGVTGFRQLTLAATDFDGTAFADAEL